MTRPEEIAAALERWEKMDEGCDLDDIWGAGDELARLLRAANPPAGAERATEPEPFDVMRAWCRMYENHSDADRAMNRKDSFTAQDHAMRVFLRERFGL